MGRKPAGVRLDSGDLAKDSRWVRAQLDRAGWKDVKIFASGDLDETASPLCRQARRHRRVRRRHGARHAGRRAALESHLQARRSRARRQGPRSREIQRRQSHLSRPQTGVPLLQSDRRVQRRHHRSRGRTFGWRRADARRSHARRPPHRSGRRGHRSSRTLLAGLSLLPARYRHINRTGRVSCSLLPSV